MLFEYSDCTLINSKPNSLSLFFFTFPELSGLVGCEYNLPMNSLVELSDPNGNPRYDYLCVHLSCDNSTLKCSYF
ncbi:hypothetical protein BpHYR1_049863 [Brachionus plicatilis]|uniref:Uncharacterized protein n=1 Tax=Brachionus plicatilis TaxID=10195 RepID=A0A3M7STK4_BRAPC|nr:hypothetical protein BpHYR1_049863 [Brachionus plicatilis]